MTFEELQTHDDIRRYIRESYLTSSGRARKFGLTTEGAGPLKLGAAEPGPLVERAVQLAGTAGLTLQQLNELFSGMGRKRLERAVRTMREAGHCSEQAEMRPNRTGRLQRQIVFYWRSDKRDSVEGG